MSTSPIKPGTARRLGLDLPERPRPRHRTPATALIEAISEGLRRTSKAQSWSLPPGTFVERLPIGDDTRWLVGTVDAIDPLRPHGDTHRVALDDGSQAWLNPKNLRRPPGGRVLGSRTRVIAVDEAERYARTDALDPFPPKQRGINYWVQVANLPEGHKDVAPSAPRRTVWDPGYMPNMRQHGAPDSES